MDLVIAFISDFFTSSDFAIFRYAFYLGLMLNGICALHALATGLNRTDIPNDILEPIGREFSVGFVVLLVGILAAITFDAALSRLAYGPMDKFGWLLVLTIPFHVAIAALCGWIMLRGIWMNLTEGFWNIHNSM